jgi:hypothetical protein
VLPEPEEYGLDPRAVIAVPSPGIDLYRLVPGPDLTTEHFLPRVVNARRPLRVEVARTPYVLLVGISTWLTDATCRAHARDPGTAFVAHLRLPARREIVVARTGRAVGHVTVWGDPSVLVACVNQVLGPEAG